jgi:hypothetical protein
MGMAARNAGKRNLDPLRLCYQFPHVAPAADFEARFATPVDVAVAYEDKPEAAAFDVLAVIAAAAGLDTRSHFLGTHRETSEVLAPSVPPSGRT